MQGWVFVTGGSRGIGRGIVRHLAEAGHEVVFTYRSNVEAAAACRAGHEALIEAVCADVTDQARMSEVVRACIARRGAPAAIILNAGITQDRPFLTMPYEAWSSVLRTNLESVHHVLAPALQPMAENGGGNVVLLSSVAGSKANPGQTNYSAAKAGLCGFARSLAAEVGAFGIRVNAIAPGFIETDMTEAMPADRLKSARKAIPLRRIGTVEDVAGVTSFLLSKQASYITGQTIVVDGGLTA